MLYTIAHFIRDKIPWLWDILESLNSYMFSLRYGRLIKNFRFMTEHEGYEILPISDISTEALSAFFMRQPIESYRFFKPHGFDTKTLKKLQCNKAFLGYVLLDKSSKQIVGYCFNRAFVHGKAFRGRMVDINSRGHGIGTLMNLLLNEVGFYLGLHLYETVNIENIASYRSAMAASEVRIIEKLENGDLFLEILPPNSNKV